MSAANIPNLLSMRGGLRGRGRGRGRGHRGGPSNPRPHTIQPTANNDHAIQSTDTDAAVSRLSAVSLGYLNDPFAQYFVTGQPVRRLPVINRGTYTRTTTLDTLVDAFLSSTTTPPASYPSPTRQIISLGAGTDTRYFRLRAQNRHQHLIYHEFDFPSVVAAKKKIVESNNLFGDEFLYENVPKDEAVVPDEADEAPPSHQWGLLRDINGQQVPRYICHPIDLRKLPQEKCLAAYEAIRIGIPTLLISECCLCYLEVDAAKAATKWFADRIPDLGIVLYEPIGTDDSFGQMMVSNLAARGIVMPTVQKYKTLEDQRARLVDLKFGDGQEARSIETIWEGWVSQQEKERVDGLEGLDEVEEWLLLARHYAIAWGWRGVGFEGWKGIPGAANN